MQGRAFSRIALTAFLSATSLTVAGQALALPPSIAAPQVARLAAEATGLALKGDFSEAATVAKRSGDPAAIKLVELLYLRDHADKAGHARVMAFLAAAPKWPLTEILTRRAEQSLYNNREPAAAILAHFATRQPVTPQGALALARAKLATGDEAGARKLVQLVWNNPEIEAGFEKSIFTEFQSLLTVADHKRRLWRLLYAQETNAAIRQAKRLGPEYQKAAKIAQSLIRGEAGAEKQYSKLATSMRDELAMKYSLTRYYRLKEKFAKARDILATVPGDAAAMGDAEAWWVERRIIVRRSVGISHKDSIKAAYRIAKANGLARGASAVEGEFLAGWIALRSLDDAASALKHFTRLDEIAPSRTEKARASYWLGRTYAELGRNDESRAAYRAAAQYSTVYYGQLAREMIGIGNAPEPIDSGEATAAARAKVDDDEVVRAFKMLAEAGAKRELNMFIWAFAGRFDTVDEMNAVASIAWQEGGPTMALRLAKAAATRSLDIDHWGYPVKALPEWNQLGKPVERALVLGLSRQESEFDPQAGSTAGAQGLMQIMPATAKLIAKAHGVSYKKSKLTADPTYNVRLGAAHLGDLIEDNGGSYVLTLVAYNAGPRRVREWLAEYGDLRKGKIDPIDWVESIPFQETRQYVQKVLQNVHVYRSRLAPETVQPMTADLKRGMAASLTVANSAEERAALCAGRSIGALITSCE
jgi:peptidoglycan lytic transglycosylase